MTLRSSRSLRPSTIVLPAEIPFASLKTKIRKSGSSVDALVVEGLMSSLTVVSLYVSSR